MKRLFLITCFFSIYFSFSQNFQLIDTSDYKQREGLIKSLKSKYDIENNYNKKKYKGAMRREVQGFYEQSQASVIEIVELKKLLFDSRFQNYVDTLYIKLKSNNSVLENQKIKIYISKDTSPNAISIGDGTIIMNIGLFSFLENEYQLLSVIAHEVAHQLLQHTKKTIEKRANLNVSVLSNKSLTSRSIRAEKYNRGARSFNVLKNLLYEEGEARRQQEVEADSLGYILYRNTKSPKEEYLNSFAVLKEYDSLPSTLIDSITYRKIFNLPEQNFKDSWQENEDFNSYNYEFYKDKIDLDSLREHPDIEIRMDILKSSFSELNNSTNKKLNKSETFKYLQEISQKSDVENLFYLNEYGLSTYLILKHLEDDYNNIYYKKWLGINFEAIYEAKKKYQLNRYVDRLIPNKQSKSYQSFLNFIWNLDLVEIKTIADYYNTI